MEMMLYHGSPENITKPLYGVGKTYNDYGQGFYCTFHAELAKEWACTENRNGYANAYQLDVQGLSVLDLTDERYSILHWMALLVTYRKFKLTSPVMSRGFRWLKDNFLIDLAPYDLVIGYRADDSYFSFARAFLENTISLEQLSYAMQLGSLGTQVVLKSRMAFDRIRYTGYEIADSTVYFAKRKTRDEKAREAYRRQLESDDLEGLYIRDMIREGVTADDPRIR